MQTRTKRIFLIGGILVLGFLSGGYRKLLAAEPSKAAWQAEWEKTVKAAEQEGQLSFYSNGGTDGTLVDFQKRFPNIKVVLAPGRLGPVLPYQSIGHDPFRCSRWIRASSCPK